MIETFLGIVCLAIVGLGVLIYLRTGNGVAPTDKVSEDRLKADIERLERALREEIGRSRTRSTEDAGLQRKELADTISNEAGRTLAALELVRSTVEARLLQLNTDNQLKLDQMRGVVDHRLKETLEQRLGESFRLVSERLEHVQRGLGEMKELAIHTGELRHLLTNVKARGVWSEARLEDLLRDFLAPDQFVLNAETSPGSGAYVEFAVRMPGRTGEDPILLPIDAKFPREDYERLSAAAEAADKQGVEAAKRALVLSVRKCAKEIRQKYIHPPHTTPFGILFLPTEGLYAEVLSIAGAAESIQSESSVVIAGPTTLAAILMSLQSGFRTLAIEKRTDEVWKMLGAVKSEFEKFGESVDKVKAHLDKAANALDQTDKRTRAITRKLREVEQLPADEAALLLPSTVVDEDDDQDVNGV
ncbi:MAG: DNA recombination protein RmuC [Planctomycetota bacterium]|nr:DNA recombination protein RmuC [Planctomycetota bacterium]